MATLDQTNPLLGSDVPIPFDRIRAEHVEPATHTLLEDAKQRLEAIGAVPAPGTWETVPGALDRLTERLDRAVGIAGHLESVATTPELRTAYGAIQTPVSAFASGIYRHAGVFRALKAFAASPEGEALTGARRRFVHKTIQDFKRSGAELDAAGQARLGAIDVELAQLTLAFAQNVLDDTNAFELYLDDASALAGLPARAIDAAREAAVAKGRAGYRLTLQAPSYIPALTYLDDGALRERLYRAYNARATSGERDNRPLVVKILELRREKARVLGHPHFADLATEDRMAKTGAEARSFVETLRARAEPVFKKENAELEAFRRELEGPGAPALAAWDIAYYAEKLRSARYDFDEEKLRPYFAFPKVLRGAFELAEALYGVKIERWSAPTWDASVDAYALREGDGRVSSHFYVDVFPRETKRDGAWMDGLVTSAASEAAHLEVLAGNFTPPVGGEAALLSHREVETTFHEFGHLLHHASSRVPVLSLAGTNVARDFVELPSQIMENWCWERAALDRFARHHETGEAIPPDLFDKMQAARTFRAANAMMRQLGFAELDLALHMDWAPGGADPTELAREILSRHSPASLPVGHAMAASFSHLFGHPVGYAAGYYSYKWAEVLEADAFSRFRDEGLYDRGVGGAFRDNLLAKGDSEDPMDLYRAFMGREPSLDALLRRDGLA